MKLKKSKLVKFILTLFSGLILITTWAIASPPGGSPDEPTHLISIYCFSEQINETCLQPGANKLNLQPVKDVSSCYLFQRDRGAGCEVSNIFTKLESGSEEIFYIYDDNQYYKFMSIFAGETYIFSLLSMRIVNGLLFILILLISLYLLPARLRESFAISTIVVSVPLGIYLVSSISTTAWIIIGAIGSWASLYSMFSNLKAKNLKLDQTIFQIILYIVSSFLIVSSRSDGIYFFAIILFAMLLFFTIPLIKNRLKRYFTNNISNLIIFSIGSSISFFSFFYFRNLANVTFIDDNFDATDRFFENFYRLPHLLLGPLGTWGLGWLDVWLSPITYVSMILVFLGLIFTSIKYLDITHGLPMLFLAISTAALPLIILQTSGYQVGEWVQPRYILPLYFPILGLAMFSFVNKSKFSTAQYFIVFSLTSIAHSFALFSNLERYIRGQNTYSYNLTVGLEWWWDQLPSPNFVWFLGSASFVIFFILLQQITKVKN